MKTIITFIIWMVSIWLAFQMGFIGIVKGIFLWLVGIIILSVRIYKGKI